MSITRIVTIALALAAGTLQVGHPVTLLADEPADSAEPAARTPPEATPAPGASPGCPWGDMEKWFKEHHWTDGSGKKPDTGWPGGGTGWEHWREHVYSEGRAVLVTRCGAFGSLVKAREQDGDPLSAAEAEAWWAGHAHDGGPTSDHRGERHLLGAANAWLRGHGDWPPCAPAVDEGAPPNVTQLCAECIALYGDCWFCFGSDCDHCH